MLCSCGTTKIRVGDGNNNVGIYKDDNLIGNGTATIIRNGIPKVITLTAKDNYGNELGHLEIRRRITIGTILFAFLPYPTYISLIFNWKFDREVVINLNNRPKSGWDDDDNEKKSAWD